MGRSRPEEYELNEVEDTITGSVGSRMRLVSSELGMRKTASTLCARGDFVIDPRSRFCNCWQQIIFLWSMFSSFFTPLEFCFFRGLPDHLVSLESAQIIFLVDVVLQFFIAYKDLHSYNMVYNRKSIAIRYAKGSFLVDFLGCVPWDAIYKASGKREVMRYMIWIRLCRARKVAQFFKRMEKDVRINYLFTRIVKLITVELYCTHTAACIFYYLATTLPPAEEGYTWIGSLTMGDYKYINFREIDFWTRYITSLYFAIVTMATVGKLSLSLVSLPNLQIHKVGKNQEGFGYGTKIKSYHQLGVLSALDPISVLLLWGLCHIILHYLSVIALGFVLYYVACCKWSRYFIFGLIAWFVLYYVACCKWSRYFIFGLIALYLILYYNFISWNLNPIYLYLKGPNFIAHFQPVLKVQYGSESML